MSTLTVPTVKEVEAKETKKPATPKKAAGPVDIKLLETVRWERKLETMQEVATKAIIDMSDARIESAYNALMSAPNSGIGAQYVQQILQVAKAD